MDRLNLFKWLITEKTHVISAEGKRFLKEIEGKPSRILICLSDDLATDQFVTSLIESYKKEFPEKLFTSLENGEAMFEAGLVSDAIFNVDSKYIDNDTVSFKFFDTFSDFLCSSLEYWICSNILNNQVLFCFTKLSPYNINPYILRDLFTHIFVDPNMNEVHYKSIASSLIELGINNNTISKVQNFVCDELMRSPLQEAVTLSAVFNNDHIILSKDMMYQLVSFLYDIGSYVKYERAILKSPLVKIKPTLTDNMKYVSKILPLEILCLGTYHYTNSKSEEYAKTSGPLAIDYNPEKLVRVVLRNMFLSFCKDELNDEEIDYSINLILELAKK